MSKNTALVKKNQDEIKKLTFGMGMAHSLICRDYLSQMTDGEIIPLSETEKIQLPQKKFRLFRINSIVYDKFENINEKLNSLFCAMSLVQDCNLVMLLNNYLDAEEEMQEFYIGVSGSSVDKTFEAGKILEQSLAGNFPGCELKNCLEEDLENLMPDLVFHTEEMNCAVSSVSVDAIQRSSDENFIQGMEKFADGMRGKPYTLMIIASPVTSYELQNKINAYRDLYTQISPYKTITQTLNETRGGGTAVTFGTQMSTTLSRAKTVTNSWGTTESTINGQSISQQKKDFTGSLIENGAALLGIAGGLALGVPVLNLLGFAYGGKLAGSQIREFAGYSLQQESISNQKSYGKNNQTSVADNTSESEQKSQNQNFNVNENQSSSVSLQRNVENKPVIDMLNSLDRQIQKMSATFGQGAYNVAAYVISSDKITSESGAGLYCSLLSGGQVDSVSAINTWKEKNAVESIQDYLIRGLNPTIKLSKSGALSNVDLTTFVPCNEMPLHFFFPRKSLPGLPITHRAEFARSIPCAVDKNIPQINLGKVFHLGHEEENKISLPKEIFCSHMCLAGAPGSGKSNMAYYLLSQFIELNLNFMVVEPAKGEYSQVLGGYPDVKCLSTQLNDSRFFSINPFAFPKGVSAIEHADSLLSLLTTCWTMYAAMTDILKDAILQIYEDAGWDMSDSGLPWEKDNYRFPTFHDLLKVLPELIEQSDYSGEVKGNYKGSLLTRIKSMTNGANKMIFGRDIYNDDELFNKKVIVNISSIKSSETRALLMGVLIIRLDEFRQHENKGMNRPLHHVTLLEEAHNILSTGKEQLNSVNAKAVEILHRAISEMRSYGEGFIIVDQTPSQLDGAVISNTATKISFNLPNSEDSLPMGKAMSLNADQTADLATLPCGVCVVRSRGWSAPVQIKVPIFDKNRYKPYKPSPTKIDLKDMRVIRGKMLTALLKNDLIESETFVEELRNEYKDTLLRNALNILKVNNKLSAQERFDLYREFFDTSRWLRIPTKENLELWDINARKQLKRRARIEFAEQDRIIQVLLMSMIRPETKTLLDAWLKLKNSNSQ
ncbi:MAG: ATP-binding protein [Selenomonadaceae bacterium]|nr:ATP-binding protein [Selenomonadaceae bacterium]